MQKFELLLRNDKQKLYTRLTIFILLFNVAAVSWFLVSLNQPLIKKVLGITALVLLLLTIAVYILPGYGKKKDLFFISAAWLTLGYWILSGFWWMGFIIAIIFFLHSVTKRKLIVSFYSDKILYPSFPGRVINWGELSNVVLKDDWLTIDFKNNKIIQQITEETIPAGNEKEFNDFCRQLLNQ